MRFIDVFIRFGNVVSIITSFLVLVVAIHTAKLWFNGENIFDFIITMKVWFIMLAHGSMMVIKLAMYENMKKTNDYKNGKKFRENQDEIEHKNPEKYNKRCFEYKKMIENYGNVWEVYCFKKGFESKKVNVVGYDEAHDDVVTVYDLKKEMRGLLN